MADIDDILKASVKRGASDIFLTPDERPRIKVAGAMQKLEGFPTLDADDCREVIYAMLNRHQRAEVERELELDLAYAIEGVARFRVNVFIQNHGVASALRVISASLPTPEEIGLTPAILKLASLPRGLLLVTGPTGSGKTTTLAALIESINQRSMKNILTIEDPIEFVYQNKNSVIHQREVGLHTKSFANSLKHALRQNPDIILVGEMRDTETAGLAMTAAETGHLCLSTLHTQDAPATVDRVIDMFAPEHQHKVRAQLSSVLAAVISQVLLPKKGGGRVCAREVMIMNPAIGTLIREGKIHQIYGAIESAQSQGMVSMDQSLAGLVASGLASFEDAAAKSRDPANLRNLISMAPVSRPPPSPAGAAPAKRA